MRGSSYIGWRNTRNEEACRSGGQVMQLFPGSDTLAGSLMLLLALRWIARVCSLVGYHLSAALGIPRGTRSSRRRPVTREDEAIQITVGWIYAIAGSGLILGAAWAPVPACIAGFLLILQGARSWPFLGKSFISLATVLWSLFNLATGLLVLVIASSALWMRSL